MNDHFEIAEDGDASVEFLDSLGQFLDGDLDVASEQQLLARLQADQALRTTMVDYLWNAHLLNEMLGIAHEDPAGESLKVRSTRWQRAWQTVRDVASNYVSLSLLISTIVMAIVLLSMGLIQPGSRCSGPTSSVHRICRRNHRNGASDLGCDQRRQLRKHLAI